MISISFLITSIIVVLIPGTGVIYTISKGISGSSKDSISAAIGCTIGIIPHLLAGCLGLSAIINTSALIFSIIKVAGVVYLVYLGVGMMQNKSAIKIKEEKNEESYRIILKGVLLNLLNPKLTLFFLSFLPQFVSKDNYIFQMITLSFIFMLLTLIIFIMYGLLANFFKKIFIESSGIMQVIQKSFGIIFFGLAAHLLCEE